MGTKPSKNVRSKKSYFFNHIFGNDSSDVISSFERESAGGKTYGNGNEHRPREILPGSKHFSRMKRDRGFLVPESKWDADKYEVFVTSSRERLWRSQQEACNAPAPERHAISPQDSDNGDSCGTQGSTISGFEIPKDHDLLVQFDQDPTRYSKQYVKTGVKNSRKLLKSLYDEDVGVLLENGEPLPAKLEDLKPLADTLRRVHRQFSGTYDNQTAKLLADLLEVESHDTIAELPQPSDAAYMPPPPKCAIAGLLKATTRKQVYDPKQQAFVSKESRVGVRSRIEKFQLEDVSSCQVRRLAGCQPSRGFDVFMMLVVSIGFLIARRIRN